MMLTYILKLLILVPLVGGLAFGALWLWKKVQPGMVLGQRERAVKMVDAVPLGAMGRLAVVDFGDKRLLIAVSRGRIELISETPIEAAQAAEAAKRPIFKVPELA